MTEPSSSAQFSGRDNRGFQLGNNNNGTVNIHFGQQPSAMSSLPGPKPFCVPFRQNPDFVDNGSILSKMEQRLAEPAARVALTGLGGIGKSQLAIEYAYRLHEASPSTSVLWIHASNVARLEESFKDIAIQLKLSRRDNLRGGDKDVLQMVKDWLVDEANGSWLLIVDNADDPAVLFPQTGRNEGSYTSKKEMRTIAEVLPQSRNGRLLITSRYKGVAERLVGYRDEDLLEVNPMFEREALALLQKKLNIGQEDESAALELVEALDCIPLAIDQASAYINQRKPLASIRQYLKDLYNSKATTSTLLNHDPGSIYRDGSASGSIFKTWRVTWDYIHGYRPSAIWLISLMSFFNCQGIPDLLLREYRDWYVDVGSDGNYGPSCLVEYQPQNEPSRKPKNRHKVKRALAILLFRHRRSPVHANSETHQQNSKTFEELHAMCNHTTWNNPTKFEDDVHILRSFSLISINVDGSTIQMHSLVQTAIREWLEDIDRTENWSSLSLTILAREFPSGYIGTWDICKKLLPHVDIDANNPTGGAALSDWAQLMVCVGNYAGERCNVPLARKACEKVLPFAKRDGHNLFRRNTATWSLRDLAFNVSEFGDPSESEILLRTLLDYELNNFGESHVDTLQTMQCLGHILQKPGTENEAEELLRKSVEGIKSQLGEDHEETLAATHILAVFLLENTQLEEARDLFHAVVEKTARILGERDWRTLTSKSFLASCLEELEDWEGAAPLFEEVAEAYEEIFGPEHLGTFRAVHELCDVYQKQGRFQDAEAFLEKLRNTYKEVCENTRPGSKSSIDELIGALRHCGCWDLLAQLDPSFKDEEWFGEPAELWEEDDS